MKIRYVLLLAAVLTVYWFKKAEFAQVDKPYVSSSGVVVIKCTDAEDLLRQLRALPAGFGTRFETTTDGIPCSSPGEVKEAYRAKIDGGMQALQPEIDAEISRITGMQVGFRR
jgi:hypothetical protein